MNSNAYTIGDSGLDEVVGGYNFPPTFPPSRACMVDNRMAIADELVREAVRQSDLSIQAALQVAMPMF